MAMGSAGRSGAATGAGWATCLEATVGTWLVFVLGRVGGGAGVAASIARELGGGVVSRRVRALAGGLVLGTYPESAARREPTRANICSSGAPMRPSPGIGPCT